MEILLALLVAGSARAQNGCAISVPPLEPGLEVKAKAVRQVLKAADILDIAGGKIRQEVLLASGVRVEYDAWDCDSYRYAFTFRGFAAPKAPDAASWTALAKSLLKAAPLTKTGRRHAKTLLGALAAARKAGAQAEAGRLKLLDGNCELSFKDPKTLSASCEFIR